MGETNLSITKDTINEFREIQRYMFLAREENAEKTYAELKDKYLSLKATLMVAGVNVAELDKIKE